MPVLRAAPTQLCVVCKVVCKVVLPLSLSIILLLSKVAVKRCAVCAAAKYDTCHLHLPSTCTIDKSHRNTEGGALGSHKLKETENITSHAVPRGHCHLPGT